MRRGNQGRKHGNERKQHKIKIKKIHWPDCPFTGLPSLVQTFRRVKFVQLAAVPTVPDAIPIVVDDTAVLQQEKIQVYVKIFISQGESRPFSTLGRDHLSLEVMARHILCIFAEGVGAIGFRGRNADEVCHESVQIGKAVVHGDEVTPSEKSRIVPFTKDSRLEA